MSNSYLIEVWGRHDQEHCDRDCRVYGPLSAWGFGFRRMHPELEFVETFETDSFLKPRAEEGVLRFPTSPNLWHDLVTNNQHPTEYTFEPEGAGSAPRGAISGAMRAPGGRSVSGGS